MSAFGQPDKPPEEQASGAKAPPKPPPKPPWTGAGAPGESSPGRLEAELRRYEVETDEIQAGIARVQAEIARANKQAEAEIERDAERSASEIKLEEQRTDADIRDRENRTNAEIDENARRVAAEVRDLEVDTQTTRIERHFFMGVVAVGVLATIGLGFLTAGYAEWHYQVRPTVGLFVSGGGVYRLRSITRRKDAERDKRAREAKKRRDAGGGIASPRS